MNTSSYIIQLYGIASRSECVMMCHVDTCDCSTATVYSRSHCCYWL